MTCVQCGREVSFKYRVNEDGAIFCGDDCYEACGDDAHTDRHHPYIDVYEYVRREYIHWMEDWEDRLILADKYIDEVNQMISDIDALISEHMDFYLSDGDDGVFHAEIRKYLHKLNQLEKTIIQWRPERDVYYQVAVIFRRQSPVQLRDMHETGVRHLKEEIRTRTGRAEHVLIEWLDLSFAVPEFWLLQDNTIELTYETRAEAEEVRDHFQALFADDMAEIMVDDVFSCDSGCGLFLPDTMAECASEGWHYESICAQTDYPGIFAQDELASLVAKDVDDVPFLIDVWFVGKIKRSCIMHDMDYPAWVALAEL
ncbi:hypothetical protein GCM10028778_12620 [Barrientosiimonas marina]|uniref:Uncharacterized protein n=1 Tax=Lentibacillus kimchii TaxID=1542911 RepID=A0ABW2UT42_9BACI